MLKGFVPGKIYLATGYTDLRKGIDGLAGIVQERFQLDAFDDALFLFCGRRTDRIKGLYWDIISIDCGGHRTKLKNAIAEDRLRLPSFDCPNPNCHAKNLVFAASAEARNHAKLVPLKNVPAQSQISFIVCCPKCKQQFAMIQDS